MVDDRPEDHGPIAGSGRPRREPPTIDLEATEVSERHRGTAEAPLAGSRSRSRSPPRPSPEPVSDGRSIAAASGADSPWAIAPVSGAVARAGDRGRMALGWPRCSRRRRAAGQCRRGRRSRRAHRRRRVQGRQAGGRRPIRRPPRATEALEKSLAALRGELASQRAQSDKLAAAINDVKVGAARAPRRRRICPRSTSASPRSNAPRAQAPRSRSKAARSRSKPRSKPADDVPLRRIVAAALLDVLVRVGDPYLGGAGGGEIARPGCPTP